MRRLYVPLRESELANLCEAARQERRHPSQQAAIFVEDGLRRREREDRSPGCEVPSHTSARADLPATTMVAKGVPDGRP